MRPPSNHVPRFPSARRRPLRVTVPPVSLTGDTLAAILLLLTLLTAGFAVLGGALRAIPVNFAAWAGLIAVLAAATALRVLWIPAHHAMYVDEPWYLEAARNLIERGALVLCHRSFDGVICDPYPKAAGWPVLLAGVFALFGAGSHTAFATSIVLGIAAVSLVAIVTRLAGGPWRQAICAALLIAVHPLHVAWSPTAETNVASTAVLLAGIAGVLLLRRTPTMTHAWAAAAGLGFAAAMRPEMAMALPPALCMLMFAHVRRRHLALVLFGGTLGAMSVAASWSLYLSNSSGTFLSPDNLGPNFVRLLAQEEGGPLTVFMLILSIIGGVQLFRRNRATVGVLLGGGALLIAAVALGYDQRIFYPRTVLGSIVLLAPLASMATLRQRWIEAALLAVILAVPGLRLIHTVSVTQMLETRLSHALAATPLPADAVVIAEWPTIIAAATGRAALAAQDALAPPGGLERVLQANATRPYFLLCDMFCEAEPGSHTSPPCTQLLEELAVEAVTAVADDHRQYGLYRIIGPAQPGAPPVTCPFIHR